MRVCLAWTGIVAAIANGVISAAEAPPAAIRAVRDSTSGQIDIREGDRPVLRYNYQMVQPPAGFLDRVAPECRKYAAPRSDYIHPLFGLDGEKLTDDWQKDHPHHRGIYWAWPEVDYRGSHSGVHALQNGLFVSDRTDRTATAEKIGLKSKRKTFGSGKTRRQSSVRRPLSVYGAARPEAGASI